MPRGRLPTGMVAVTSSLSPSMMVMLLPFSLETKISRAADAPEKVSVPSRVRISVRCIGASFIN